MRLEVIAYEYSECHDIQSHTTMTGGVVQLLSSSTTSFVLVFDGGLVKLHSAIYDKGQQCKYLWQLGHGKRRILNVVIDLEGKMML